jgi:HK97 gp10 family phage protein
MSVKLSITGFKEIDSVLKGLPNQLQDRVLKNAHADAAKVLVRDAQNSAPVKTGNLRKSIGVERISIKKTNSVGLVRIGPRRKGGFKGFHGHLVEFGKTNRDGTRSKANPFFEQSYNRTKAQLETQIKISVGKKLEQFMRRTIKK